MAPFNWFKACLRSRRGDGTSTRPAPTGSRRNGHPGSARLGLETLEERVVPAGDTSTFFNGLAQTVQAAETSFQSSLAQATVALPVVGKSLSSFESGVSAHLTTLRDQLKSFVNAGGDLNQALRTFASAPPNGVTVQVKSVDSTSGNAEVVLNFSQLLASEAFTLNTGFNGLLSFKTTGGGLLNLTVALQNLDVGVLDHNYSIFNGLNNPAQLQLQIDGKLGGSLKGKFGVFGVTATPQNVSLEGFLSAKLTGNGGTLAVSAPQFPQLVATVNLRLTGELETKNGTSVQSDVSLPNIMADLHFVWDLSNAPPDGALPDVPDVTLDNVQVGLGSLITSAVAPLVQAIQQCTAPSRPVKYTPRFSVLDCWPSSRPVGLGLAPGSDIGPRFETCASRFSNGTSSGVAGAG